MPADEAYRWAPLLPPVPVPPPVVAEAGDVSPFARDRGSPGGAPAGVAEGDVAAWEFLADAARRAAVLLREALAHGHEHLACAPTPSVRADALRLAAAGAPWAVAERLRIGCGDDPEQWEAAVAARRPDTGQQSRGDSSRSPGSAAE